MPQIIQTDKAPAAIGPYSQAVVESGLVFCSGQIALDPATGELLDGSVADQTRRVLENLKAVLEAAGSDLNQVVKTTIYLIDMDDFTAVNEVYAEYFGQPFSGNKGGSSSVVRPRRTKEEFPARATIAVVALPKGAKVEIEAVAKV